MRFDARVGYLVWRWLGFAQGWSAALDAVLVGRRCTWGGAGGPPESVVRASVDAVAVASPEVGVGSPEDGVGVVLLWHEESFARMS